MQSACSPPVSLLWVVGVRVVKNADSVLELCGFCECLWGLLEEKVLLDAVTFIAEIGVGHFEGSHKALLKEELIMI